MKPTETFEAAGGLHARTHAHTHAGAHADTRADLGADQGADMRADRPAAATPSPRRRRRVWPWLLGAVLALAAVAVLAAAFGATALLSAIDPDVLGQLDVTVNGDQWISTLHGAPAFATVLAVAGGLFAAMLAVLLVVLVVLVIVPVVLLLVLGAAALGVGTVLLALLLTAALALSPLWLIVLALWLALRRKPVVSAHPAATMPA